MTFQWLRPRAIGMDGKTLAKARAYEAKHSLPGYPDEVEPSADLRVRVLGAVARLQVPPCEQVEDDEDLACITCENSGKTRVGDWTLPFCPDCGREPFDQWAELFDDMERGK